MWITMVSKYIIMFVSLLSIVMICTSYHLLLSFILNYFIARRLRVFWSLYYNSKVVLTKEEDLSYYPELIVYVITICFSWFCYFILSMFNRVDEAYLDLAHGNLLMFIIAFLIWIGIFFTKKLTESEISYLSSVNNLTLGYGTAIWYYKNYLDRILPYNFLTKVEQYEKMEGVELPHKLYILCPKSCKVEKYIDRIDYIECSKDLPPYEIDHGGIARRKYSVSVYRIKYNGEFFRCALEYAQPLKSLLAFQERGRISLSELDIERESFIKNLTLMLKDHKNSFEVCELVEYDDKTEKLHEILSGLPSVQKFKFPTEE